jgi:hypothetical protein
MNYLDEDLRACLFPVKMVPIDSAEMSKVFARFAAGGGDIVYNGNVRYNDVYCKIDYDEEGMSTYFHYWVYWQGAMCKVGSGGYIAMLHTKPEEILLELPLRVNFERKEIARDRALEQKKLLELADAI